MGKNEKIRHRVFSRDLKSLNQQVSVKKKKRLKALDVNDKNFKTILDGQTLPSLQVFENFKRFINENLSVGKKSKTVKRIQGQVASLETALHAGLKNPNTQVVYAGDEMPNEHYPYLVLFQYRLNQGLSIEELANLLECQIKDIVAFERNLKPIPNNVLELYVHAGAPQFLLESQVEQCADEGANNDSLNKVVEPKLEEPEQKQSALPIGDTFGERVKKLRVEKDIRQADIALAVFGKRRAQLCYKIETNVRKSYSDKELRSLAEILNVPLAELKAAWKQQDVINLTKLIRKPKTKKSSVLLTEKQENKGSGTKFLPLLDAASFGDTCRKCRERRSLTQPQVSKLVFGLKNADPCFSLEKNRRKNLTGTQLKKMAKLFNVDSKELSAAWNAHVAKRDSVTSTNKQVIDHQQEETKTFPGVEVTEAQEKKEVLLSAEHILSQVYESFGEIKALLADFRAQVFLGRLRPDDTVKIAEAITLACIFVAFSQIDDDNDELNMKLSVQFTVIKSLLEASHVMADVSFLGIKQPGLDDVVKYGLEILNSVLAEFAGNQSLKQKLVKLESVVKEVGTLAETYSKVDDLDKVFEGLG